MINETLLDLRRKVLQGHKLTAEETRQVIEIMRQNRYAAKASPKAKASREEKAAVKVESLLADLGI